MLKFHFCSLVEKEIQGKSFEKSIRNKFNEIENQAKIVNTGAIRDYGNGLYTLKTYAPNSRIIIQAKEVNGINAFFIRDIITNKDFDYFSVSVHPKLKNGAWLEKNPLLKEDENSFIRRIEEEENAKKNIKKTSPPESLTAWLKDFDLKIRYDVFESEDWVKYTLNGSFSEGMRDRDVSIFRLLLSSLIDNEFDTKIIEPIKVENGITIYSISQHNVGIIYCEIESNIVLLNGAHLESQKDYWNKAISKVIENTISFDDNYESLCRYAYRAYPKWAVKNEEQWFAIQRNNEMSNLSLTQEQINFFKKFHFPYYINGQAGSGKSTMLYYLFANACYYKIIGDIKGEIIFLTENAELLKHTQKSVYDLLTNNPEFSGCSLDQIVGIEDSFVSFKKFLLSLIPEGEKYQFSKEKYLNFSLFKRLYEDSHLPLHIKNNYSAEESWFTIITYIYGYDSNRKISSQEYESTVFGKSQKIPKDKYEGIENFVLPFYEKLINENQYWDKLKIIRYIESNVVLNTLYSLVVCDEAQDFCRVELQFILKMSEFLKYDLSQTEEVPIVFAGDPNQTVNPTGFRQGEMTEMLHKELKNASFEYKKDESIYIPSFNYRSIQPVVNLANFVQYYRKKNFNVQMVRPQVAKRQEAIIGQKSNIFLNYETITNNEDLKKDLVEKVKYKIFVIPVDTHEKDDYINRNYFLSKIPKPEIKTAVEAKGAEYQQVVLFGFGEYYLTEFNTLINSDQELVDQEFKKGYYFNKLYVGLTRAQNELIIIDSVGSEENFWRILVNTASITDTNWSALTHYKDQTILFNPESISNVLVSTPEIALENAHTDKQQGVFDNNAARLKVAAQQFLKLGNKKEFYICLALSEKIKGNWKKAAEYYLEKEFGNSKLEDAAQCFFQGKFFSEILNNIGDNLKSSQQKIRIIVSRLMHGEPLLNAEIVTLFKNKALISEVISEIDWREELIKRIISDSSIPRELEQTRNLVELMESISNSEDFDLIKLIGELHYQLHNYERCISAWDRIDFFETETYVQAKIYIAELKGDLSSRIIWLDKIIEFKTNNDSKAQVENEIIQLFSEIPENGVANIDVCVAVYKSILIQRPTFDLDIIGKKVETEFNDRNNKATVEFYENLFKESRLTSKVLEFIIDRWLKLTYKHLQLDKLSNEKLIEQINHSYKQLSQTYNFSYIEITLEDIKAISEFPQKIRWNPPSQLSDITIKNFRRFRTIDLTNLGKYNLIVGDNNVGKTSLLEGLLFSHEKSLYFSKLAFAYVDRSNLPRYYDEAKNERYFVPADFIFDFVNKSQDGLNMGFNISYKRQKWDYELKKLNIKEIEGFLSRNIGIDDKDFYGFYTNGNLDLVEIPLILKNLVPDDSVKSPLIPFGKGFNKSLAKVYSEEIDSRKSERTLFIENMKVFIPNIERIVVNASSGEIGIEESDFERIAPLHQYGEGANKLFRILVQLTLQRDGRLLVDEIDAGIHFSKFENFWKVILRFANLTNTQVFATTHNLECVKYFKKILQQSDFNTYQSDSRVITLIELPDNTVKAYTRSFLEFDYELENELEIRGGKS